MKIKPFQSRTAGVAPGRGTRAFTLAEMMVTMSIFMMMMGGMLELHIFGLKEDQIVQSKLGASDQSRRALNQLVKEVRASKGLQVGNNSGANFIDLGDGTNQVGGALKITFPGTTNTSYDVLYYFVPGGNGSNQLYRVERTNASSPDLVVENFTNSIVFRAEDYLGYTLTDNNNHTIISTLLQFRQYQYPLTKVGTGYYYDYYQISFKVTSRNYD